MKRPEVIKNEVGLCILKEKDLKDLSRGMYLCRLFSGAGKCWGSQLVIYLYNVKFSQEHVIAM